MPADFYEAVNAVPIEVRDLVQQAIGRAFRQGRYPHETPDDTCYYRARDAAYYLLGKKILGLSAALVKTLNEDQAE